MSVPRLPKVAAMKKEHWLLIVAAGGGALIYVLISARIGQEGGVGFRCIFFGRDAGGLSARRSAGPLEPKRSWRWGAAPMAGQFFAMLLMVGWGNLLPLGIIVFGVLAIPPMMVARLGAYLRSRLVREEGEPPNI